MEDLSRKDRLARRLAIAAMICCSTAHAIADQPTNPNSSASVDSLRSLLSQGFDGAPKPAVKSEALPAPINPQEPVVAAPKAKLAPKQIALPLPIERTPNQSATIKKAVPAVKLESVAKPDPAPSSLAELLRPKSALIVVPQIQVKMARPAILPVDTPAAMAPKVKRFDVAKELQPISSQIGDVETIKSNEHAAPTLAVVDANVEKPIENPISFVPPMEFPLPTMSELIEIETEARRVEIEAMIAAQAPDANDVAGDAMADSETPSPDLFETKTESQASAPASSLVTETANLAWLSTACCHRPSIRQIEKRQFRELR